MPIMTRMNIRFERQKRLLQIYIQQLILMSKKKIEQIPLQIVNKQTNKLNLRKTLLNTKFNWLVKYISKENHESIEQQNYLATSIKICPQMRNHTKRSVLKENRLPMNHQSVNSNRKSETKNSLEHKFSSIRNRIFTQNIEHIPKCRKERNTSLLLHSNNPKQTFNFIENDTRRLGHHLKTDLQLHKRRYKKRTIKTEHDQFKLTPWNLDDQDPIEGVLKSSQIHFY